MDHYFRVQKIAEHQTQARNSNFIFNWLSSLTVTGWLIFVNVIVFLAVLIMNQFFDATSLFALQSASLFENFTIWTLLTSMFTHIMFFHLFVNMLSLFFIGKFLEMLIGKKRFFWLYIFSGLFAGIFFAILSYFFGDTAIGVKIFGNPQIFAVGASGAIFGVAGVLALLTPRNKVYLIAGPLIALVAEAIIYALVKNQALLGLLDIAVSIYIFISIFSMLSFNPAMRRIGLPIEMPFWFLPIAAIVPLIIVGLFVDLPIGNMAHLGGLIAGLAYGSYLRIKYKNKVRAISAMFSR